MDRDFGREIDELKAMVAQLMAQQAGEEAPNPRIGHVEYIERMHPDEHVNHIMQGLQESCGAKGSVGRISYMGVVASGGRQSNWIRQDVDVQGLLEMAETPVMEKVLACIGNGDRMRLLLSILRKPQTVAELVESGFSSTGQVYHLLKPLIVANMVEENPARRGQYVVPPHRVQGIVMLLAGISDMLDPTCTQGRWEA